MLELGCAERRQPDPDGVQPAAAASSSASICRGSRSTRRTGSIRRCGLRNIRIEQASILDIEPEWGTFDYIICHGVFSWVEREVQDAILRDRRARISAANGVAYVSYNTYPGWHMREMVRAHDAVSRRAVRRSAGADRAGARAADVSGVGVGGHRRRTASC